MLPRPRAATWAVAAALLLGGCGGSAGVVPPTGVDQLQIPSESPAPDDFVRGIDNPWLAFSPGSQWTYDVIGTGGSAAASAAVRVLPDLTTVAGVATTQVQTVVSDSHGVVVRTSVASYAQDRAGNVWLFAESVRTGAAGAEPGTTRAWQAGRAGALAGLAMAARPRVGDGYLLEQAPGVAEDRAVVGSLEANQVVDGRTHPGLLFVETSSRLEPAAQGRQWFERGQGLLLADLTAATGSEQWTLRDHTAG